MYAHVLADPGPEGSLSYTECPVPEPSADEVRIRVSYAGLNRADIFQRQGSYPLPEASSPVPGLEVSGVVDAVGADVRTYQVGDKVCALLAEGGYAEYVTAPEALCLPVPESYDLKHAATMPEALCTAWLAMVMRGALQRGETVLFHGGSSGIGVVAVQMAKLLGAKVFTTVGTDEKCRMLEAFGAMRAINYQTEDFVEVLKTCSEQGGADVVVDMVGGEYISRNYRAMRPQGRCVSIAFLQGSKAEVNVAALFMKELVHTGVRLRTQPDAVKREILQAVEKTIWPAVCSGELQAVVDRCFPFQEAPEAQDYMLQGKHCGKILLDVAS